jgi:hypothetical protein
MLRRLLRILQDVWSDWLTLMSGIASVALAALGAILAGSVTPWAFWPAAYLCLLVAAFRAWRKEYLAREALEAPARGIDAERKQYVQRQIAAMSADDREALALIAVHGPVHSARLNNLLAGNRRAPVDRLKLSPLAFWDPGDFFDMQEVYREALHQVLGEGLPPAQPPP